MENNSTTQWLDKIMAAREAVCEHCPGRNKCDFTNEHCICDGFNSYLRGDNKAIRLIAAAPELLSELAKAHLVINRLVEEIHKADTKSNTIVELIKWPTIGEVARKNVIANATEGV